MASTRDFYRDAYADEERGGHASEDEPTFALRVNAALDVIRHRPRRILDFGCGGGAASKRFSEAGHDIVGVDISESAMRVARERVPAATFVLIEDEAHIPYPDGAFEACFCTEVIEHLFDVQGFIKEIHRVLAPDGLFLLTTPYHGRIKNVVLALAYFERHFDPTGGHIRFFTRQSLDRCLRDGGFESQTWAGIGRWWPMWKSIFVVARRK